MLLTKRPAFRKDFEKIPKSVRRESVESMFKKHNSRQRSRTKQAGSVVSFILNRPEFAEGREPKNCVTIPLGTHAEQSCLIEKCKNNRIKNWRTAEPTLGKSRIESENMGPYSRSCTFTKYLYTRKVESWGYFVSNKYVYVRIETKDGIISKVCKAPRGWRWELDDLGIKIVKVSNTSIEIHPTASHFIGIARRYKHGMGQLLELARLLYLQRRKLQKESRLEQLKESDFIKSIRKAQSQGMRVCLIDSLKAGNCYAGTKTFARKNGLEENLHYPPVKIYYLLQKTGDRRIRNALVYALRRHEKEMTQGFANLCDHVTKRNFKLNMSTN